MLEDSSFFLVKVESEGVLFFLGGGGGDLHLSRILFLFYFFVSLSVHLSACLFVCLSVCCLSVRLYIYLPFYPSTFLYLLTFSAHFLIRPSFNFLPFPIFDDFCRNVTEPSKSLFFVSRAGSVNCEKNGVVIFNDVSFRKSAASC